MIASYRHNFIFIKTRKTAGTSIEIALTPFCGPEDILAPISLEDELARLVDGRASGRNFDPLMQGRYQEIVADAVSRGTVLHENRRRYRRLQTRLRERPGAFYNHMPASILRQRLDPSFWKSAFKFTIERHPYEQVVSSAYFHMSHRKEPAGPVSHFVDNAIAKMTSGELEIYSIDGEIAVDRVLRFESLEAETRAAFGVIGLPLLDTLPRAKSGSRLDRRPAKDILSAEQKRAIYAKCRRTFEAFGYDP